MPAALGVPPPGAGFLFLLHFIYDTLGNRPDLFPGSSYVGRYTNPPTDYDVPEAYLSDETFAAMLSEAEKYLGYLKQGLTKKPFPGNIYITDQRACFKISMTPGALDMDLPLENIKGFSVSGAAIFTQVTIHSWTGETYSFIRQNGNCSKD